MPRYVQLKNQAGKYELWEVERLPPGPRVHIIGDLRPDQIYRSPIDGTVISSKRDLRYHKDKHDVILHGDYGPDNGREYFESKQKALERKRAGDDPEQKKEIIEDLLISYEKVQSGYKPQPVERVKELPDATFSTEN
jgi:hypothetical protein